MSYGLQVKVTVEPEDEKKKKEREAFEEFFHRYQAILSSSTFPYDPLLINRFLAERDELLRNFDLGFRERMLIREMSRRVMEIKQRKEYEYRIIGEEDFYGLWFF